MIKQALLSTIGSCMASAVVCGASAVSLAFYALVFVAITSLLPVVGIVIGSIAAALFIWWTIRRINREGHPGPHGLGR